MTDRPHTSALGSEQSSRVAEEGFELATIEGEGATVRLTDGGLISNPVARSFDVAREFRDGGVVERVQPRPEDVPAHWSGRGWSGHHRD